MKVKIALFYSIVFIVYLNPFLPLFVKGTLGIVFIIISSTESSLTGSLRTAVVLDLLLIINMATENNTDVTHPMWFINAIVGSLVYLSVAFYLGKASDKLKSKNKELMAEIEARKGVEKELKENLTILEGLMSTLPTPVCFKDLDYRFTGCNTAYEEYFGLSEKELIGRTAHDLFDASVADICLDMDIKLMENKVRQAREVITVTQEGRQKFFIFIKALLNDEAGNPTGLVCVFLDTSEHMEHERLMRSVEEEKLIIDEMQKYDALKTEFFSNISHELRTPLNVVFCAVQLLEIGLANSRETLDRNFVKKNVMSIKQNSLRLLRLVNNLIDITKIDAQTFEINLYNQDIVHVVREIVLSVSDYITNKGLKLAFHSELKERIMAFDEEKIERIILNLLSNAIKFSPPGESIYVDIFEKECSICIRVRDTGIGIPHDRHKDIFQRFYQISPMNTRLHEGSGIGLNLVKSLVEMHHGTITVDSQCGKGTCFLIEIPALLIQEEPTDKEEYKNRQARIENIQLEFSDIYTVCEQEYRAV